MQWHPTPVLLPGKSQGRESLVGCRLRTPEEPAAPAGAVPTPEEPAAPAGAVPTPEQSVTPADVVPTPEEPAAPPLDGSLNHGRDGIAQTKQRHLPGEDKPIWI